MLLVRPALIAMPYLGLPASSISRLQYFQNSAARLLTHTKYAAHITLSFCSISIGFRSYIVLNSPAHF